MISNRVEMYVLVIEQDAIGCTKLVHGVEDPPDVQNSLQHTAKLLAQEH